MLDATRLLNQFLGPHPGAMQQGTAAGGPFGNMSLGKGAAMAGLAALLMGSGRRRAMSGGSPLGRLGGMAAVGMLAYQAYRKWQASQRGATASAATGSPPAGTAFNPTAEDDRQSVSRHILRAMIAAAKADGHVDADEQRIVLEQIDRLQLNEADKSFLVDELRAPLDLDRVAAGARTPEEASEIYTASLLAIDVDNPDERDYLARLAAKLNLDPSLVKHLHDTVEVETVKV